MDRSIPSGAAAAALGTSVPRLLRAARRGLPGATRHGTRTRFDETALAELRRRWGWTPAVPGFSTGELRVLAALGRRPFGIGTQRGVARAAALSPTAAGTALRRLLAKGLVIHNEERVVEGMVTTVAVWRIEWLAPEWARLAPAVARVELPDRPPSFRRTDRVPARLAHVFWNEDLGTLDVQRDAVLIAERILRSDDPEALAWMASSLESSAIATAARSRGLARARAQLGLVLATGS